MAQRTTRRLPGLVEAFYDPLGSFNDGSFGGPIGGHSDHVHVSDVDPQGMLQAIALAQSMGLATRENPYVDKVDPVHVQGSYHYRDFPGLYNGRTLGEALDASGPADAMARYYQAVTSSAGPSVPVAAAAPAQAAAASPVTQQLAPAPAPMPQLQPQPDRQAFAQALLGGISDTGQLSQQGLVQAITARRNTVWR